MFYNGFELYNVAALLPHPDGGCRMSRVPADVRAAMSEQGQRMACNTAGCEFRFVLRSGSAKITLRMDTPGAHTTAILYFGGVQSGWQTLSYTIGYEPTTITLENHPNPTMLRKISDAAGYAYDPCVLRLTFDSAQLILMDAQGDVRPPEPSEVPEKRFLMYGSSITHGSLACSANLTYLAQIGTRLDADFYSFGFAGSCLLEREVADYIAEQGSERNPRTWDFAILELGINALGLPAEEFAARVDYLLDVMLRKNPGKKIFVIDIFYHLGDFSGDAKTAVFREIVRKACEKRACAYPRLYHIDGRTLLSGPRGLSGDFVHPNVAGVREIADNLTRVLTENKCFERV